MHKLYTAIISLFLFNSTMAQFSVRLVINTVATKPYDDIYVTGTFNGWNPKDEAYKLKPSAGGRKAIVLKDLPSGNYAFKFTRGNFDKVECAANGTDITDRTFELTADATIECTVAGWKDDYPERPKRYTASPQVRIIDTAFKLTALNKTRRIWVYLPKSYNKSNQTYPVLYMHDGQNLFNEQTAAFGEWGVDECLDSLTTKLGKEIIVVGIDHGGNDRLQEYSPYNFSTKGALAAKDNIGQGDAYIQSIINNVKPFIDGKYRTKKGPNYTAIAGSSMGGLISAYAVLKYPQVFNTAGIFSPSFWLTPEIYTQAQNFNYKEGARFYLYAGGKESNTMVADLQKFKDIISKQPQYQSRTSISPLAQHNEKAWQQEFQYFVTWWLAGVTL
jgi:predicted alpha/beta superfamily hydrolase